MRQYEVFLDLKNDLAMVSLFSSLLSFFLFFFNSTSLPFQAIQATFRAEEIVNSSHRKMKKEEGKRIAAVDVFHMAEKSNQELKSKLTKVEKGKRSA